MKSVFLAVALLALADARAVASADAPKFVLSSEDPALMVKDARVDPKDGKIRGTVYLRFGYTIPRLPHVHVYGLDASGRLVAEGCDKLSNVILSDSRHGGRRWHESFSANLGSLGGITKLKVVASSEHDKDCRMEDNRILKLFEFSP